MNDTVTLSLDNNPIRFTPEGQLFIIDAISAVSQTASAGWLWNKLRKQHPEIDGYCDYIKTTATIEESVCDSESWAIIQEHLFDYLISSRLTEAG